MTGQSRRLKPSAVWDRFFWSFLVTVFAGLLWMKFLQDQIRFESGGWVVAIGIGLLWFWRGLRKLRADS
jgi:hypothetical protein